MKYIAHKTDSKQQTILEHLTETAKLAQTFAKPFHAKKQAEITALLHDIGKYSHEFQCHINGEKINVDHSTAGCFACYQLANQTNQATVLASSFAIAGHHVGIPNLGYKTDTTNDTTLLARIKRAKNKEIPNYEDYKKEINNLQIPQWKNISDSDFKSNAFYTRMLYSCLVDANFLNIEKFYKNNNRNYKHNDMHVLLKKLHNYINQRLISVEIEHINKYRSKILKKCMDAGLKHSKNIATLTAPTGSGKTIASLAYALEKVINKNMNRIIYVIPYTSDIKQISKLFKNIFGKKNILEDYNDVIHNNRNHKKSLMTKALENWDAPIIITTNVQFFESIYSNKPSKCRKLHNIANSLIIFDEPQTLPLHVLNDCVYAITQLVENYECSAVLCTATQPALNSIIKNINKDIKIEEICPEHLSQDTIFKRVSFENKSLTNEELCKEIIEKNHVLCITNTKEQAETLYQMIKNIEPNGCYYLSTQMCAKHRRNMINKIKQHQKDLQNGSTNIPCRVISTSIIEIGVDVDFPKVYREKSGLDSILQSAGKCNRNGLYDINKSIVTIFETNETIPQPIRKQTNVFNQICNKYKNIDEPSAIEEYFIQWRKLAGHKNNNENTMQAYEFKTIAKNFHIIDEKIITVYVPYNDTAINLLTKIGTKKATEQDYRKLSCYGVPICEEEYEKLLSKGIIDIIDENLFVINNKNNYTDEIGLII